MGICEISWPLSSLITAQIGRSSSRLCREHTEYTKMKAWPLLMESRCIAGNWWDPVVSVIWSVHMFLSQLITWNTVHTILDLTVYPAHWGSTRSYFDSIRFYYPILLDSSRVKSDSKSNQVESSEYSSPARFHLTLLIAHTAKVPPVSSMRCCVNTNVHIRVYICV